MSCLRSWPGRITNLFTSQQQQMPGCTAPRGVEAGVTSCRPSAGLGTSDQQELDPPERYYFWGYYFGGIIFWAIFYGMFNILSPRTKELNKPTYGWHLSLYDAVGIVICFGLDAANVQQCCPGWWKKRSSRPVIGLVPGAAAAAARNALDKYWCRQETDDLLTGDIWKWNMKV